MQRAAILAKARPVALDTNGTVREARGLTSSTNTVPFWMANCTFIRPTTFSAMAICTVCARNSCCSSAESENGGSEQAESPECTPACSMCSMMPVSYTHLRAHETRHDLV